MKLTFHVCLTIIIININIISAIRYKNRKYYDAEITDDKYTTENIVDVNSNKKPISQSPNIDSKDVKRDRQMYGLAYQKTYKGERHSSDYYDSSDTFTDTSVEPYTVLYKEHEKINLENRRENGLEPKGFWSGENAKKIKRYKKLLLTPDNNTRESILFDKDRSYIDKLDQKYLKRVDKDFKEFQKRYKIKDKDFVRFKRKELKESKKDSVEKRIDKENKKYIKKNVDIDRNIRKETNATPFSDLTRVKGYELKDMTQEVQRRSDRKHNRRKYSSEENGSRRRRDESIEKKQDSQERNKFETRELHALKSERKKTKHRARSIEVIPDASHKRKSAYYPKDRDDRRKTAYYHRGEKDRDEGIKYSKEQLDNSKEKQHKTKRLGGRSEGRYHYRNKLPKEISIEFTDIHRRESLSEENERYLPEEMNDSNYKLKTRKAHKLKKVKSNQHDTKYRRHGNEDRSQIDHKKEYLRSKKDPDDVNPRMENPDSNTRNFKRVPIEAKPRRIKSFSVERFERAQKQTQDQYFEQEINDYHNPDILPPQIPHRKLKPIHMPSKKISRGNEPPHPIIKPVEDVVELREESKPEFQGHEEILKKPIVAIETTTLSEFYRSENKPNYVSKNIDTRPNEEVENFQKVIKNNKNVEHVTKSRYEQYLQHFRDNHFDNNKNQLKKDNYESNTNVNENGFEKDQEKAKNSYDRNNYYRNKKEYDNGNNNEYRNHNDNYDKNAQFVDKNYKVKTYIDKNNKFETTTGGNNENDHFENKQAYENNENYKSSDNFKKKSNYENTESNRNNDDYEKNTEKINKNEIANIENVKTNDYYDKNSNDAPNYGHENKNYKNRDNNNKDTDYKSNYENKNDLNNNNYKNNGDNTNNNNYEEIRNNNPSIQNSNYRDNQEKIEDRKSIERYEQRPPYENQPEDRYNLPAKPVTPNYQNEMNTRGVIKDYDKQQTMDTNYANYPENYQSATQNINNDNPPGSFLGPPEGESQESHLGPPQSDNDKESLRSGPKIRIEEKPGYRIQYLDFRRRYRKKHNLSDTKSNLQIRKTSDVNIMTNDDSNRTKSKISKDLIRQWRKGYSNVENEKEPVESKKKRKTSRKKDFDVIGPREIAYLKQKYTLPRAEKSGSKKSINTVGTSEEDKRNGNFSLKKDKVTATNKNDKMDLSKHTKRRKKKRRTKKVKTDEKQEAAEKDDVLNLTDAIIENKTKENETQLQSKTSIERAIDDELKEMEEIEEKNYTENFKNNVWSALEKSILGRYNENKTDNIMFLNMAPTPHDPKTEPNFSDIETEPHHRRYESDSEISDTGDKIVIPTLSVTKKHDTSAERQYKNVNIQMLQYATDTQKYNHDKYNDDKNNKLKGEFEKARKHKHTSDSHVDDHSKNHHNLSSSKHEFYKKTHNDEENWKSEHHLKNQNIRDKEEHLRHKNKYNDEQDDTEIYSDNSVNEKEHKYHKNGDNIIVDQYVRNKDGSDLITKTNSHEKSINKPSLKHHMHTHSKNDDNDHKTERSDQTHDNAFTNHKMYDKISVKRDFLDKHHVKHKQDNIIKRTTDENVEYPKIKKDNKYITHSKNEQLKSEHPKNRHNKSNHSEFNNKIQNNDTHKYSDNTENQNGQVVFTKLKKQNETYNKIVVNEVNSTNNEKEEPRKDTEVRDVRTVIKNNSEAVTLRTLATISQEHNIARTGYDDDTDNTHWDHNDKSNSNIPFIVMLVQELDKTFKCLCTAITITPNFAITAAHCIPTEPKPILHIKYENHTKISKNKKNCNKTDKYNSNNTLPDVRNSTKVLKVFRHPNYRQVFIKRDTITEGIQSSTVNDIAVLKTQYQLPLPVGKLSAFEFNSLLGVSVNFYGMENSNCTKGTLADITLRKDSKKYNLQTRTGAVATCSAKAEGITLCLATECNQSLDDKLNMLEGGPVIFSDRVVGIVSEIEPAITFIPVSPYLDWITQILEQEKPIKKDEKVFVKIV